MQFLASGFFPFSRMILPAIVAALGVLPGVLPAADAPPPAEALARRFADVHRFATLFTAQDVRNHLSSAEGRDKAVDWCRKTAVTHVFIETFRDGYQAERDTLAAARDQFRALGFQVSGCVTPTRVGKSSTGWRNTISCYTDIPTQQKVRAIFAYAASLFDQIMIDDFWFTDCACPECDAARQARQVRIGDRSGPVAGDAWEDYRCELMARLSRECVLIPARQANPRVSLIIKYPQWYDRFHERGYEVTQQTLDFDRIWVGTETRDYRDSRWGGTVPYEAYFIMRWLGGIGGPKCGGGWYDWLGTTEHTYIEQARQTVLAGAHESLLFCYGGLQRDTGPANILALRTCLEELLETAREVRARTPVGIAAFKPANSHPENESRVFDFVGMLGIPLVPCHEFPTDAPAAFFSLHALKDPAFVSRLKVFLAAGKPVLVTDGLAARLAGDMPARSPQVQILPVQGDPKQLLDLAESDLDPIRQTLLAPWKCRFRAPPWVGLYLFSDGSWVVENFRDEPVQARLNGSAVPVPARGWVRRWTP